MTESKSDRRVVFCRICSMPNSSEMNQREADLSGGWLASKNAMAKHRHSIAKARARSPSLCTAMMTCNQMTR